MIFALVLIAYLAFIVWIGKRLKRRDAQTRGLATTVGLTDDEGTICECSHPRSDIDGACTRCGRLVVTRA